MEESPMTEQPNPNELLLITREELERCCSQMSAAGYKVSANYVEASVLSRSRPAPSSAPDCITCPKHAIGYGIGINEARLTQCNTCMFDGKRECMYHGYPDDTIPQSCEYKIGKHAVIAPIESQLHNKQHDAAIRNEECNKILDEIRIHALKAGLVGFDDKGKIRSYRYINPKILVQKIESLRNQQKQEERE